MKQTIPATRPGITHSFRIDGTRGYINVGLVDGKPVELFLTLSKEGSTVGGFADCFARLVSISLQHGVPLDYLCDKMRHHRFAPMGLTENTEIPEADSIIDYVFAWMQLTFIKDEL